MAEVGGGWQSVEASGADQWPDGGNSGILTLHSQGGLFCRCSADAASLPPLQVHCLRCWLRTATKNVGNTSVGGGGGLVGPSGAGIPSLSLSLSLDISYPSARNPLTS